MRKAPSSKSFIGSEFVFEKLFFFLKDLLKQIGSTNKQRFFFESK